MVTKKEKENIKEMMNNPQSGNIGSSERSIISDINDAREGKKVKQEQEGVTSADIKFVAGVLNQARDRGMNAKQLIQGIAEIVDLDEDLSQEQGRKELQEEDNTFDGKKRVGPDDIPNLMRG